LVPVVDRSLLTRIGVGEDDLEVGHDCSWWLGTGRVDRIQGSAATSHA
jgi:hypothetical protein